MTKRAVLYARINNHDEPKLTEQLQICREYAQDCGWQVVAELVDRGVSGLSDKTSQLDRALRMARAGEFDVLIVHEPNRLSRNLVRILAIAEELERPGIEILYALDNCHDGRAGAIAAALMGQIVVYARVSDDPAWRDNPDLIHQVTMLKEHALRRILPRVDSMADAEDTVDGTSPERLQVNERKRDQ